MAYGGVPHKRWHHLRGFGVTFKDSALNTWRRQDTALALCQKKKHTGDIFCKIWGCCTNFRFDQQSVINATKWQYNCQWLKKLWFYWATLQLVSIKTIPLIYRSSSLITSVLFSICAVWCSNPRHALSDLVRILNRYWRSLALTHHTEVINQDGHYCD